jgi:cytidylate kinase
MRSEAKSPVDRDTKTEESMSRTQPKDIVGVLASLRAGMYEHATREAAPAEPRTPAPFVTISRQAGAGGRTFARKLVERLNDADPGPLPWTVWDNELVEKVVAENHLPAAKVASLGDERPSSWIEQFLAGLAVGDPRDHADESTVFSRVALTIHALAEMGRVVIVGRGGAFITHDLPGGVHLRLVAPLADRVELMADQLGLTEQDAAAVVRERDHNREAFYHRYWPNRPLAPESFTATLNTAAVAGDRLVDCVLPLVLPVATRPTTPARAEAAGASGDCCSRRPEPARRCDASDRRAGADFAGTQRAGGLS